MKVLNYAKLLLLHVESYFDSLAVKRVRVLFPESQNLNLLKLFSTRLVDLSLASKCTFFCDYFFRV